MKKIAILISIVTVITGQINLEELIVIPSEKVQQALTLRWGVTPLTVEDLTLVEDFFGKGEEMAVAAMGLKRDELVVLVAGLPIGIAGGTNLLRVLRVGETANHT